MSGLNPHLIRFLRDIKAGLSDEQLQAKYGLSGRRFYLYKARAMDHLAKEKSEKTPYRIKISAKEVLGDIRSGMDDEGLMTKFQLTGRQLQSLFRKLIKAGLASPMELAGRLSVTRSQVTEAFTEIGKAVRELD